MRNESLVISMAMLIGLVLIFVGIGTIETEGPAPWSGFWPGLILSCLGLAIVVSVVKEIRNWKW